ncbi:AraC family transcriptional regulator [Paenibacillus nasutitermitis]|uniref:HTH araC/xylS-type domain-containing protein n=1 Tax=Paenibacillus nasutitermitis TaxID=1652958 RepID=A0A917DKZ5_9BACL|nr:AraC family transcriptional regulator [Paenibacillus nasutitermitis]GGD47348.1 hypothetical protein GCM10010911_01080 [Paenibacillus nasutitermitis]
MAQYPLYQEIILDTNGQQRKFPFMIWTYLTERSELHHHNFAELSFAIEGRGSQTVGGIKYPLLPGTVTFIPPHQLHHFHSDPGSTGIRKYCIIFDIALLSGTPLTSGHYNFLLQFGNQAPPAVTLNTEQTTRMKQLMDDMLWENDHTEIGRTSLILAKLTEVLLLLLRVHFQTYGEEHAKLAEDAVAGNTLVQKDTIQQSEKQHKGSSGSIDTMRDVIQYVHLHYIDSLKLEQLASRYGISPPYFSRSFKKRTGQSFLHYLHALRVRSAISLLISTDLAVTDLPPEVGFDSFRTFTRVFKAHTGMTPSEYRTAQRNSH